MIRTICNFIMENGAEFLMLLATAGAIIVYLWQKRDTKRSAATLILWQVDSIENIVNKLKEEPQLDNIKVYHSKTIIKENMEEIEKEQHGWGKVPFIALRNNSKELSDLKMIKGLIDAYDLICSEGTNSLLDLVDLYWVIAGYGGETASAIAKKLQVNRAVQISDSSGKVETKQVHLPIEGRIQWLKLLRKDIFHFGMGVDTDSENLGNAPSGVSLKFQYAMFNLKINGIVPEIKKSLKQLFWFLLEDCNRKNDTDYNVNSIDIKLNLNSITDDMEMVNMITASKGIVSEKTLLAQHPFVQDVNSEIQAVWQEKERVTNYDTDEQTGQTGNHKSTAVSAKNDGMES